MHVNQIPGAFKIQQEEMPPTQHSQLNSRAAHEKAVEKEKRGKRRMRRREVEMKKKGKRVEEGGGG